jgi:hypothetical protein
MQSNPILSPSQPPARLQRRRLTLASCCTRTQAARKAPHFALGFRVEVLKWLTLVRLLMGEIPERSSLQQKGMQQSMLPYLDITQAVRDVSSIPCAPYIRTAYAAGRTVVRRPGCVERPPCRRGGGARSGVTQLTCSAVHKQAVDLQPNHRVNS